MLIIGFCAVQTRRMQVTQECCFSLVIVPGFSGHLIGKAQGPCESAVVLFCISLAFCSISDLDFLLNTIQYVFRTLKGKLEVV